GLLSLFNILGRFFWASLSDFIGRKLTYAIFFVLGIMLYYGTPSLAHGYQLPLFVLSFGIILSMYGGGFATVPAYLADMFGTQMVGAIHGRLLTAWATAGVLGPVVVNYIREGELARGVPREQLYDKTMLYLVGMLLIGFVANLLVRRVSADKMMTSTQLATLRASGMTKLVGLNGRGHMTDSKPVPAYYVVLAWLVVLIPLLWGFYITIQKSLALL
ncbi:MAG: MFS transporter, partial [Alphaproteobacteria bacterium]|nr:MFS transporter [Alphaproteobacteria bacterium]